MSNMKEEILNELRRLLSSSLIDNGRTFLTSNSLENTYHTYKHFNVQIDKENYFSMDIEATYPSDKPTSFELSISYGGIGSFKYALTKEEHTEFDFLLNNVSKKLLNRTLEKLKTL